MSFKPIFEHGLILKQHMLEALRDYPIEYVNTRYSDMGNGIIAGLNIELTKDNSFYVGEGIVKLDGEVHVVKCSNEILFSDQENYVYLEISKENKIDGVHYNYQIIQKNTEDSTSFELFRYVKNAEIKKYVAMDELFKDVTNRIDQRHVLKSIVGGSCLVNDYFLLYANYILSCKSASMQDCAFAYQCLNGINNVEIVKNYFELEIVTNEAIIEAMKNILDRLSSESEKTLVSESEKISKTNQIVVY